VPPIALSRSEATERAGLLSEVSYAVDLDLTTGDERFASVTVVRFRCARPGASTFLDLEAASVGAVEVNGVAVTSDAIRPGRIRLDGLAAVNTVRVVADCDYTRTGVGLHRFADPVDGGVYLHTQFEPFEAHRVFACFDQPDLKGSVALGVRAPGGWTCISNGAEIAQEPEGDAVAWRFLPTLPISTYLVALVAGPFHRATDRHGDIDLALYCRQSLAEHLDADEMFTTTKQGLDFFAQRFDHPYPFGKYDQLFVPEFNAGAMENPGCITFNESYVFRSKVTDAARRQRANTTLHEMAHMWFGDLVTMRWWDDLWLNESFATYTAYLAATEATRFTDSWAAFASSIKAWAYAQDQLPSTHPIAADMVDTDAVRVFFDGITYAKGASVLKQLVHWVGTEAFTEGLRGYFRRHAFGNAELSDFLAALEEASGRDLGDWSRQWLETAGLTSVRAEVIADDRDTITEVVVVQEAPAEHPTLRAHRLAIGLYDLGDDGLVRRRRVELDVDGPRTTVEELVGETVPDLLLVNDDDLAYAKVRLDERSLDTVQGFLGHVVESLARALCWGATWDMTRDSELPAHRFVALVAEHATAETDAGLLQTLLGQAESAADRYADPSRRDPLRRQLAGAARGALDTAEPGGDTQLLWARALASTSSTSDELVWLRGLLDGEEGVEGLAVDTELRWHIVTALAAEGAADEALIAAELERDPTDIGARRAATAGAARPDATAKRSAWDAVTTDRDLPLATARALIAGLFRAGQDALLAGYVTRYPDAVAAAWAERSADEALLLTSGLYPSTIVDETVVAAADAALARDDVPEPGQRLIAESRDATLRALRARAADREA